MSGTALVARCPAKVNLALRVLRRRSDGYHDLDTIFQAIDLWDEIEARPDDDLRLVCDDPTVPADGSNLVLRAARRVRALAPRRPGAALTLRKSIPAGGGLGGGSSDAAGTLLLCARLWGVTIAHDELTDLAATLGADVPFFLTGGTARGLGRGDEIRRLPFAGEWPLVLGLPPFAISTAEVFSGLPSRLTLPANGVSVRPNFALKWRKHNDFAFAVNDLESVVFPRWPELQRFRDALLAAGARSALLSGSGSTVYGVFDRTDQVNDVTQGLAQEFDGWTLRTSRAIEGAAHLRVPEER